MQLAYVKSSVADIAAYIVVDVWMSGENSQTILVNTILATGEWTLRWHLIMLVYIRLRDDWIYFTMPLWIIYFMKT